MQSTNTMQRVASLQMRLARLKREAGSKYNPQKDPRGMGFVGGIPIRHNVQWPNPNIWSALEYGNDGRGVVVKVTSPLLIGDAVVRLTSPYSNRSFSEYRIEYYNGDNNHSGIVAKLPKRFDYNAALSYFLSPEGYKHLKYWASGQFVKVLEEVESAPINTSNVVMK